MDTNWHPYAIPMTLHKDGMYCAIPSLSYINQQKGKFTCKMRSAIARYERIDPRN